MGLPLEARDYQPPFKYLKPPTVRVSSSFSVSQDALESFYNYCLKPKQLQTLQLLSQGLPNWRIARNLDIPVETVKGRFQLMLGRAEERGIIERKRKCGAEALITLAINSDLLDTAMHVQVRPELLTCRENAVLLTMVKGLTSKQAEIELGIKLETIKVFKKKIFRKLGGSNKYEAIAICAKTLKDKGLLDVVVKEMEEKFLSLPTSSSTAAEASTG